MTEAWPSMSHCEAAAAGRAHGSASAMMILARQESDRGARAIFAREFVRCMREYRRLKRRAIELAEKEYA